MVEMRPWGEHGANLPDLQEKLNTYLNYVEGGQLWRDYPAMAGKKVAFRLHTQYPLTKREENFLEIVKRKYLEPRDISWSITPLGTSETKGYNSPEPTPGNVTPAASAPGGRPPSAAQL